MALSLLSLVSITSLGQVQVLQDTGNQYELAGYANSLDDAIAMAGEKTNNGQKGHLLTITTQAEQEFITDTFLDEDNNRLCWRFGQDEECNAAWLAASDRQQNHRWHWIDGPEKGKFFWIGNFAGKAIDSAFNYWAKDQPQNSEDCSLIDGASVGFVVKGQWHDYQCTMKQKAKVIVEYEFVSTTTTNTQTTHTMVPALDRLASAITSLESQMAQMSSAMVDSASNWASQLDTIKSSINVNQLSADDTDTRLTKRIDTLNTTVVTTGTTLKSVQEAIQSVIGAIPKIGSSSSGCDGDTCVPYIEATTSQLNLNAPNGKINIVGQECQIDDVCATVAAIADAIKLLKN